MAGPWEKYQAKPEVAPEVSGPWTRYSKPQESKPLAANAGLAELAARVVGLPVDTLENAVNLTRAAQGVIAGAVGAGPEWMPPLLEGSFGGSESIRRGLRATGEPGLSPDNPNPKSASSTAAYEFVARGGVLPGGAVPAAGSLVAEKIGGPEWAAVGALAPSAAVQAYNAARAPTLTRQQAQNVVRDQTLKEAQEAGYVVPPSQVNPTFVGNRVESIAGKAALNQDAALKNQQVTNAIARREVGLPENAPITEKALEVRRNLLSEPYREISSLSPAAAAALQKLRDARSEAQAHWRHYNMTGTPESQRIAKQFDQRTEMLEKFLEKAAKQFGSPDLVEDLRAARTAIAKTYDIERALNPGDGNVDARILGRALDRGRPLTGELATAAKFAEAFPHVSRPASSVQSPGVSKIEGGMAALLAGIGAGTMGPTGLALGALPLASHPARSVVLSGPYQRRFAQPNYQPGMQPEDPLQALIRQITLSEQLENKKK